MAMHFVRQNDKKGDRTLGVMTKIDLMSQGSDVANYLRNDIPTALKLKYGYFLAKNRSTPEVRSGMTVQDGYNQEQAFFESHPVYCKMAHLKRLGVPDLANFLSTILVDQIKQHLPSIMQEVDELSATAEVLLLLTLSVSNPFQFLFESLISACAYNVVATTYHKTFTGFGLVGTTEFHGQFCSVRLSVKITSSPCHHQRILSGICKLT